MPYRWLGLFRVPSPSGFKRYAPIPKPIQTTNGRVPEAKCLDELYHFVLSTRASATHMFAAAPWRALGGFFGWRRAKPGNKNNFLACFWFSPVPLWTRFWKIMGSPKVAGPSTVLKGSKGKGRGSWRFRRSFHDIRPGSKETWPNLGSLPAAILGFHYAPTTHVGFNWPHSHFCLNRIYSQMVGGSGNHKILPHHVCSRLEICRISYFWEHHLAGYKKTHFVSNLFTEVRPWFYLASGSKGRVAVGFSGRGGPGPSAAPGGAVLCFTMLPKMERGKRNGCGVLGAGGAFKPFKQLLSSNFDVLNKALIRPNKVFCGLHMGLD